MTLLIAYDGSPAAGAATRAAGGLFPGASATVLTIRPEPLTVEQSVAGARIGIPDEIIIGGLEALNRAKVLEAEATAAQGARLAADAGLIAEADVVEQGGNPARALRRVAADAGIGLIVCGTRGLGPFSRLALGSTSSALLHHAERPVLVVPEGGGDLSGPLVLGYDGSGEARAAIAAAGRLLPGREVIVVTVWESLIRHSLSGRALARVPIDEVKALTDDLDEYFRALAAAIAEEGAVLAHDAGLQARPETIEAAGRAWRGLLASAQALAAAAVVVGTHGRGGMSAGLLGSISSGLVHGAQTPVLVVPTPPAEDH